MEGGGGVEYFRAILNLFPATLNEHLPTLPIRPVVSVLQGLVSLSPPTAIS